MLTYNQENLIGQTIESIMLQETNFSYQLVIGEDFSCDSTRQICENFAGKYSDKVKLLPSDKRLGLINNFMRTIKECDGKYIAVCDGDDYWIDPYKLQKQYDFMESHPDYAVVYTGIRNLYPSGEFRDKEWSDIKFPRYFEELIFANFIPSVTAFYRNINTEEKWPEWIIDFPYGDWPVYLWLTRKGEKIGYLDEITGVYRKEIGVSEQLKKVSSDIAKVNLGIVKCIYQDDYFHPKREVIFKSLTRHKYRLSGSYFREGQFQQSLKIAFPMFFREPLKVTRMLLYLLKRSFEK